MKSVNRAPGTLLGAGLSHTSHRAAERGVQRAGGAAPAAVPPRPRRADGDQRARHGAQQLQEFRVPRERGGARGHAGAGVLHVLGDVRRQALRPRGAGGLRAERAARLPPQPLPQRGARLLLHAHHVPHPLRQRGVLRLQGGEPAASEGLNVTLHLFACLLARQTVALMLAGLCHDLDHPGYNNNFLALSRHPLAAMYRTSILEYHHYFLAKKLIEDKRILHKLCPAERARVLDEVKYAILSTDLAAYFQVRAQLAPVLAQHAFDWTDTAHRRMLKGILMTTCDLSGCCKPFGVSKAIAESVYEEFYEQGDRERALGYSPLSMMDRRRSASQPAEQIQFLSVVVLPCLALLAAVFPNTGPLADNCRKTQEAWHEEIEMRGQKLWRQEESARGAATPPHSDHKL